MAVRRAAVLLLAIVGAAAAWPGPASGSDLPSGFRDDVVLEGLDEPTTVRFAADGRVFVAEKTGKVLVFDDLADTEPTVFADLRTQVYDRADKGLLGLALDPGFPAEPYVYALYTYDHMLGEPGGAPKWGEPGESGDECPIEGEPAVDDCPVSGRLVRMTAAGDQAVESGGEVRQEVLVEGWCQQFYSHSIGDLEFGPEGLLYASGGEGGDANSVDYGQAGWPQRNQCGDPPVPIGGAQTPPSAEGGALRAQDARTPATPFDPTGLSGAVIRVDPDSGAGVAANPLAASSDANERRLLGYGFRNPFRFAIDPDRGEVYVSNVGWNHYEEIDRLVPASAPIFNSGWPCYEGPGPNLNYQNLGLTLCDDLYAEPAAVAAPFFLYRHGHPVAPEDECPPGGSAVSGLAFYDGGPFPAAYDGALFFADSVRGCIYVMMPGEDGRPDPLTAAPFMSDAGPYPGIDLEVGPDGSLYYVSLTSEGPLGEPLFEGAVHRISYDPDAPRARLDADRRWGPASPGQPLQIQFDASGSSSSLGQPLGYEWDLDGNGSFEATGGATRTVGFTGDDNVTVAVRVGDAGGGSIARLTVYPDDTPPQPEIETPDPAPLWRVGQKVQFSGSAADAEDGGVGDTSLYWRARLHHCPASCHAHPLQVFPSTDEGALTMPNHDYPAHVELALTAVDSRGLAATETVDLYPRPAPMTIGSEPAGLSLGAGLLTEPTPFALTAIAGGEVVLSAPPTQQLGGRTYSWRGWSDGGGRVHPVIAEPGGNYTAVYAVEGAPEPGSGSAVGAGPGPSEAPPATRPGGRAPRTLLRQHPPRRTESRSARFAFGSSEPGSRFRCKLNRGRFRPCRSPRVYRRLQPGPQVFRVVAIAPGGRADPAPSVFRWRVL